jgi:Transposase DDE domain
VVGSNCNAQRRITRWEHEHLLEAVQRRLDANPEAMRQRRETVEHPFGTMKAGMGATHFLTKTLPKVAAEMALSVLAYNLTRVMNIVGVERKRQASCLGGDCERPSGSPRSFREPSQIEVFEGPGAWRVCF